MAISNNYKKTLYTGYNDHNTDWTYTRYRNVNNIKPQYNRTYAEELENAYSNLAKRKEFDIANDEVYKQYAAQANALSGLAISGNQSQAQNLTGGYGSSYAPSVAMQGINRAYADNSASKTGFAEASQNIYQNETQRLYERAGLASDRVDNELNNYKEKLGAAQAMRESAYRRYDDDRSRYYNQFTDNRDYWSSQAQMDTGQQQFKAEYNQTEANQKRDYQQTETAQKRDYQLNSYDTYNSIAATKCAKYADAGNNSGMKAYLNGLVSAGKITQYMADDLYEKYAEDLSAYGGSSDGSSIAGMSGYMYDKNGNLVPFTTGSDGSDVGKGIIWEIGMNRSTAGQLSKIERLFNDNKITEEQARYLMQYFNLEE